MNADVPNGPESRHIAVFGAGAWGTTLALLAHRAGQQVTLITHREESAHHLRTTRAHPRSLPGIAIPDAIEISSDPTAVLPKADVVVVAVPTQQLRSSLEPIAGLLAALPVLSAVKGLEIGSLRRPTEVIREVTGARTIAGLSGPNLSTEIASGKPATTVVAADEVETARSIVPYFHSTRFRVYVSTDVVGVELGGALKNIIAIGAGIGDGLGAGDNAKAAFLTRGIAEIARLGVACGADVLTFAGLSGIGDLIATCASPLSRNHRVGVALASGMSLDAVMASMSEVAEGVPTTKAARELGRAHGVELPIVEQMYRVLFEGVSATEAITELMQREPTIESLLREH